MRCWHAPQRAEVERDGIERLGTDLLLGSVTADHEPLSARPLVHFQRLRQRIDHPQVPNPVLRIEGHLLRAIHSRRGRRQYLAHPIWNEGDGVVLGFFVAFGAPSSFLSGSTWKPHSTIWSSSPLAVSPQTGWVGWRFCPLQPTRSAHGPSESSSQPGSPEETPLQCGPTVGRATMAKLLGIKVQNYRALADVGVGQVKYASGEPLPELACFIGPNGCGKSTLLDAFAFIAQCLADGVEAACDNPSRGGFERLRTQGAQGPITFELFFDGGARDRPIVYELGIDDTAGVPTVVKETLRQRRGGETRGKPYYFLKLTRGQGKVWAGKYSVSGDTKDSETLRLTDTTQLGIATLGNLAKHPRIVQVRE